MKTRFKLLAAIVFFSGIVSPNITVQSAEIPSYRGKVILVVDQSLMNESLYGSAAQGVNSRIKVLSDDLVRDGWRVLRHDVPRGVEPPGTTIPEPNVWSNQVRSVRALIKADYEAAPTEVKSVFLIGHVAVPYAGYNVSVVGQHFDWGGAHPADAFYGEMTSAYGEGWTDYSSVGISSALFPNVPGDGKFDQDDLPSSMELAVGRVDFAKMNSFFEIGDNEAILISRYLDKDHDFRTAGFSVPSRALDVGLPVSSPPFCAIGGNLSTAVGANNVTHICDDTLHWFPNASQGYLIGFGGGDGGCDGQCVGGIGTTPSSLPDHNFVNGDSRVVFINFYGSFIGTWDIINSFLRAPLANPYDPANGQFGYGLTAVYGAFGLDAGTLEKRAWGACIGQALFEGWEESVNLGLMGDPTLRLHNAAPATGLSASQTGNTIMLDWADAPYAVGYRIYRAPTKMGPYVLADTVWLSSGDSSYVAPRLSPSDPNYPDNFYMVRVITQEVVPRGIYLNMSAGTVVQAPTGIIPYLRILHHPANSLTEVNTAVAIGEPVAFTVDAGASEALTYQWFMNGSPVVDNSYVSGATTRSLLIQGVSAADKGVYHVVVSTSTGSLQSNPVSLPIAVSDQFSVATDSVDLDVLYNDSTSIPSGTLSIVALGAISSSNAGELTINPDGKSIRFVPNLDWLGSTTLSFKYIVSDGSGFSSARVTVRWTSRYFEVSIPGANGNVFSIWSTEDFQTWKSLATVTMSGNSYEFSDGSFREGAHRSYYVKQANGSSVFTKGYVRVTVPGKPVNSPYGEMLIANQLNNPNGNTLEVLFPNVPQGTIISKYDPSIQAEYPNAVFNGTSWSPPNITLNPGEGARIKNPTATPLSLTFVGSLLSGEEITQLPPHYSLISSAFPLSPNLNPPTFMALDEDGVQRYNASILGYIPYTFFEGNWYDETPIPEVGEAFFFYNNSSATRSWTQNLAVTPVSVNWVSPADGSYFSLSAPVTLRAIVDAPQGIATLQFLEGEIPIGTATLSGNEYVLNLSSMSEGDHILTARAVDGNNGATLSLPRKVSVSRVASPAYLGSAFQFNISEGTAGQPVVYATENFETWVSLGGVPQCGSSYCFSEAIPANCQHRFYAVKDNNGCLTRQVGFVCVSVPANGEALIANQLNNPNGNTLEALFPNVPSGTIISKYDPSIQTEYPNAVFDGTTWNPPNVTLNPGEGARIQNLAPNPLQIMFIGFVPTGQQNVVLPLNFSLVSSAFPIVAHLSPPIFQPVPDDQITRYNPQRDYLFYNGDWVDQTGPTLLSVEIGEAFFLVNGESKYYRTWSQSFSSCPP